MKKLLLLFAPIFAGAFVGRAQVSIIPKAGYVFSSQRLAAMPNPNNGDMKAIQGFTAGIGCNVPIGRSNLFSIQPELVYIQKGYQEEFRGGIARRVISKNRLNYLEMLVLGQLRFGTERIKALITAGPSLAYGLNGRFAFSSINAGFSDYSVKVRFRKAPENPSPDVRYLAPQYYNRLELGMQAGLGIGLAAGPGILQLEARYGHSLTRFFRGNDDNNDDYPFTYDDQPDYWNRAASFTLGYAIPLKGK
jgi:hypothetical protein